MHINEGPPVRPVCDISDGVGHKFSYIISNILQELCYGETVCNSTEEMLAAVEETNSRGISENMVLGSLDVKALYPSLDIPDTVEVVCQMFEESNITFDGVDYEELGLYLALNLDSRTLEGRGLAHLCPTRKNNAGRRPTITASGNRSSKADRFEPWNRASHQPDEEQKRRMMTEAMRIALTTSLSNHMYEFNKVIRRQCKGGPIGMDLTGTVAKIFMR